VLTNGFRLVGGGKGPGLGSTWAALMGVVTRLGGGVTDHTVMGRTTMLSRTGARLTGLRRGCPVLAPYALTLQSSFQRAHPSGPDPIVRRLRRRVFGGRHARPALENRSRSQGRAA